VRASAHLQTAQVSAVTTTTTMNPQRARWGTRTTAHIDLIVAGEAIVIVIIVDVVVVVVVDSR
jgi:hypothetical protein